MLDFNKIVQDYEKFRMSLNNYRLAKQDTHNFYMLNLSEIENYIEDYYIYVQDKNKNKEALNKLFKEHPTLKTYLSLELTKAFYKEKTNMYSTSKELDKLGKCILCRRPGYLIIVDLDSSINYCYEVNDEKIVKYIELGLKHSCKYITDVYINEISVIQVIYEEIRSSSTYSKMDNKKICSLIEKELNKARMFDDSYIVDGNNYLPVSIDDEYKKLIALYQNDEISKSDYYKKIYYYRIISGEKIESLYLLADDEQKEYIMSAYEELSSLNKNQGKVHIRTTSKRINKEVLKRRKRSDTK